jgi:hypothetical protein
MTAIEPIERRLSRFLQKVLAQRDYDLIVCGERKATATLRLLIQEMQRPRVQWPWRKVLSSAAIEAYDWESFRGRSILVFEELVHHGKGLKKCREMLEHYAPVGVKIYSAAFAVWEGCVHRPDIWHYAALSDDDFRAYRDELVTALQQHGSLLLDTEHIELTAKVECGLKDFFGELARSANDGQTYSFVSAPKRMSVTVMQPGMVDANALPGVLTPGSNTTGVVNKCRILERTHNYFSILPILYPNTRCVVEANWLDALPGFVNRKALERAKPIEIFYLVGLLASIEGLRAVVAALGDLIRRNKVVLEVAAENFAHLVTMFPNVDIHGLRQHVNEIVLESKHVKPLHSRRAVKVRNITEQVLSEFAFDAVLEASSVAQALIAFITPPGEWVGTAKELLDAIAPKADDRSRSASAWPISGRGMRSVLTRLAPALRRVGINVEPLERSGAKGRRLRLVWKVAAQPSQPSEPSCGAGFRGDGSNRGDASTDTATGNRHPPTPENNNEFNGSDDSDDSDGCAGTLHMPGTTPDIEEGAL